MLIARQRGHREADIIFMEEGTSQYSFKNIINMTVNFVCLQGGLALPLTEHNSAESEHSSAPLQSLEPGPM